MHPLAADQYADADARARIPAPLRRIFPSGPLTPLPMWPTIYGPGKFYNRLPLLTRHLLALAFRFRGKRCRRADIERIELHVNGVQTVWSCSGPTAAVVFRAQLAERPPARYAFISLCDPMQRPLVGALNISVCHSVDVAITFGPETVEPLVDWWGVFV